jgi:hypothetical protein
MTHRSIPRLVHLATGALALLALLGAEGCGKRPKRTDASTVGSDAPGTADAELVAKPGTLSVRVDVDRKKKDGRPWDVGSGPPDIALCATNDGETQCFPSGSSMDDVRVPKCRDAYHCEFTNLPLSLEDLELEIFDVDIAENDDIGSGKVTRTTTRLGAARIAIVGDGIDDKPFVADPKRIAGLMGSPATATGTGDAGKTPRTTSPRGVVSAAVDVSFCPHAVVESSKVKGAASFRCESWKGRWKKVGLGELDPLFSTQVTSASGAEEEHRWFEVKDGPLAGSFVEATPGFWQVASLAWVQSEKVPEIDPWLCENRTLPGYDRTKCAATANTAGSAPTAKASASARGQ